MKIKISKGVLKILLFGCIGASIVFGVTDTFSVTEFLSMFNLIGF